MHIEIYCDRHGEHRWRMVSANGRKVADSGEGYSSKSHALRAVKRFLRRVEIITV